MRTYRTAVLVAMIAGVTGCASPQRDTVAVNASGGTAQNAYGRVDVRAGAVPPLVHPEPIVVMPISKESEPVYMHLPLEQVEKWPMFCHRYHACNAPVYFVKSEAYEAEEKAAAAGKRKSSRYRVD
ncbi:MAG: hypothetical protein AB7S87_03690 [Burkholderiales bacterium]